MTEHLTTMTQTIQICMAQLNLKVGDLDNNTQHIIETIETARDELKADIVLFPELAVTGYLPEDLLLRDDFMTKTAEAVHAITAACTGIEVILSYPKRDNGKLMNASAWIRNKEIIAEHFKAQLPNLGLLDEKRYFKRGNQTTLVQYKGITFGLLICEDLWHEEPIAQASAAGAQCILSPNASPFHSEKLSIRNQLLQNHAHHHKTSIIYVNTVSGQDEFLFDGQSTAIDRDGSVAAKAPAFREALLMVELKPDATVVHQPLEEQPLEALIYEGLVLATRDYIRKNGFFGAIIGLSGGIDSALTLAIAVDALGAENVHAVMMPSQYTASISLEDAKAQAQTMRTQYDIVPIKLIYESFMQELNPLFSGYQPDITEENLQSRIRGTLLMALSNKTRKLVLATGNKSEMATGYTTLYGDMAGGFSVLKDVYKTMVYALARYRNTISLVIPERVITRPPSAELAPDQLDQDSLPPYEVLDVIIKGFVEDDLSVDAIVAQGFDEATVRKVIQLIQRNEYKRRQSAPGIRVTRRAFGRNRRYPMTSGFKY